MKTITLNKNKYSIPENWKEVTLETYYQLFEIGIKAKEYEMDIQEAYDVVQCVGNIKEEDMETILVEEISDVANTLNEFVHTNAEVKFDENIKLDNTYSVNDSIYYLETNVPKMEFTKMMALRKLENKNKAENINFPLNILPLLKILLVDSIEVEGTYISNPVPCDINNIQKISYHDGYTIYCWYMLNVYPLLFKSSPSTQ